ncbi:MAG: hypothetical protein O7G30_15900, partial [Proteobacteria bacterium]|nr:hypothetical protein [Pseudomonadota bacterium]
GEEVPLRVAFPAGATRLTVLVPDSGLEADLPGADAGEPVERDGQRYRIYEARDLPPGWRLDGVIHIPQTRRDIAALREPRADLWVEFDDTALVVSEEHHLRVEGSSRLVGTPEAPLLRYELPEGARFLGLSQGAGALGIGAAPDGGLEVLGPLPPGASTFGFRYRLPVDGAAGARLARRFPLEVGVLNLLVADSGVVLDDVRLHRRRPFRSGTRHYLHREGFRIEPTETVTVGFSHLERSAFGGRTSLAIVLAAAAAGAFFLAAPLGWTSRDGALARSEPPAALQSRERESIVESLRDLEHDFETGKVAEADYQGMRSELRSRALELMREEREARRAGANASTTEPDTQLGSAKHDRAGGEQSSKGVVARCPECQGTVRDSWTYCAQCGATLPAEGGAADA